MAELATIARPYAEALFKSCSQTGSDLGATVAWVEELAAIAADPQLRQLADSPKVTVEQVLDVITGVARSALPELAEGEYDLFHRKRLQIEAEKVDEEDFEQLARQIEDKSKERKP